MHKRPDGTGETGRTPAGKRCAKGLLLYREYSQCWAQIASSLAPRTVMTWKIPALMSSAQARTDTGNGHEELLQSVRRLLSHGVLYEASGTREAQQGLRRNRWAEA